MVADEAEIFAILEREVSLTGPAPVNSTTSLRREAQLDSLDFAVFLLAVQDRYGVKIPDADVETLDSIAAIAQWLNTNLN